MKSKKYRVEYHLPKLKTHFITKGKTKKDAKDTGAAMLYEELKYWYRNLMTNNDARVGTKIRLFTK